MRLIFRRLIADDIDAFRTIRLAALKAHPEAYGSSLEEFEAQSEKDILNWLDSLIAFGAFSNERLLGLGAYFRESGIKTKHAATIVSMYTAPELRGQGVARQIIEQLADHAKTEGIVQLYLAVGAKNDAAKKSYQKAGFETYGVEPRSLFVNGKYIDQELMVRFLGFSPNDKAPKGNKNE